MQFFLRKGCYHTFQAQDHSLFGHDVKEEVVADRGEKEIKSREDAKQWVAWYIQSLIAFGADCSRRNRWWDGFVWKSRHDLDGMCLVLWNLCLLNSAGARWVRHQANPESRPENADWMYREVIMPLCMPS